MSMEGKTLKKEGSKTRVYVKYLHVVWYDDKTRDLSSTGVWWREPCAVRRYIELFLQPLLPALKH